MQGWSVQEWSAQEYMLQKEVELGGVELGEVEPGEVVDEEFDRLASLALEIPEAIWGLYPCHHKVEW